MKKITKIILAALSAATMSLCALAAVACKDTPNGPSGPGGPTGGDKIEEIDYVSQLKLDFTTDSKKQEVTVKMYIDGDTTHFNPVTNSTLTGYNAADFAETDGFIKARYLAIDTPESTGDIEKWGKAASNFTHDKLADAKSIIVESDNAKWNIDSTGERYTLWIWYMPSDGTEYRNLNVEILQNGYAYASATGTNRYGKIALAALDQARALKLHVYSPASTRDPLFYEGAAIETDLRMLRFKPANYSQKLVRVQGVVVAYYDHTAYVEEQFTDEKTSETFYCGMQVFCGYTPGKLDEIFTIGNRVEVVGNVTLFSGNWQISGVKAGEMKYNPATDSKIISTGHTASNVLTSAANIINEDSVKHTASFEELNEDGEEVFVEYTISYAEAAIATSVSMENLHVDSFSMTTTSSSYGALSLRCTAADGTKITVRTEPLKNASGALVSGETFVGQTISVRGLVEKYYPNYESNPGNYSFQIKVYSLANITM